MSAVQKHHTYDADMAAHDADGNVKLALEADDHLGRLLAPDTEIPWFKSIIQNFRELISPQELPPLELTSKPIEVKDLWGQGTNPKRVMVSVLIHAAVFAGLIMIGTNETVQKKIAHIVLIAPPPPPKHVVEVKVAPAAGGARSAMPELKAAAPKAAPKTFTPPLVAIERPALTMDASLVTAPDAWAAPSGAIGNPLGAIGGGGGLGAGTSTGTGTGKGTGSGTGAGTGTGTGNVYNAGNGVTNPTLVSSVTPEYSEEARKDRLSGFVTLAIVVNTSGKATDIQVLKGLGEGLDEKAIEAVQKWVFKPGLAKGIAVAVRAQVKVGFTLL